jgi:hypothetical protein
MAQIKASLKFDAEKGSATVVLELGGETEMEHELLAQFFTSRSVSLVPFHVGDELESRFVISQADAFGKAQRAVENRIRARDGRPSVEEEEAAKAARAKAQADREAADKAAQAAGFANAGEKAAHDAAEKEQDGLAEKIAAKLKK